MLQLCMSERDQAMSRGLCLNALERMMTIKVGLSDLDDVTMFYTIWFTLQTVSGGGGGDGQKLFIH